MLLPGPEAQQLATYIGWLLHGSAGGLAAGVLFVLPGALLMLLLSWAYAAHGEVAWVAAGFGLLRAIVLALVADAVIRVGRRALRTTAARLIAAAAFVALSVGDVPFPAVVIGAGLGGLVAARGAGTREPAARTAAAPSRGRALRVLLIGLFAWWAPLAVLAAWRGPEDVLTAQALFFSKAAMVTFGGAYAVLGYVNQAAVRGFGWLLPGQMLDGLGLAETTPGPLILVLQFVGYLAAYRNPGELAPALAGALGALVALWATFAPCFLWIFLGAPYVERLRGERRLAGALAGITAGAVGVILSLGVALAAHVLVARGRLDPLALVVAAATFLWLRRPQSTHSSSGRPSNP